MMQGAYDFFSEIFLSTEISGYFGPLALVVIGYYLATKDKGLGVLWFVVECLVLAQYFALVEATPDYWWQIFILLMGSILACVVPLMDR
jgi:hypothetical protein